MKRTSPEVEDVVVQLYLNGTPLKNIETITGCKCIKHILKRYNIKRKRNPKEYNTNKKEKRNKKLIEDYLKGDVSILELCIKYNITDVNLYRILKEYNVTTNRNLNHHWVIHKKRKEEPLTKCKFYILENYYGYTKIGITTKNKVKDRYRKNINVFYEMENTVEFCYNMESELKKLLKSYIPQKINKNIDGWSECYNLEAKEILSLINT